MSSATRRRTICIRWPDNRRERLERGPTDARVAEAAGAASATRLRATNDYFRFYAGQPEDVRKAYEEAMGI